MQRSALFLCLFVACALAAPVQAGELSLRFLNVGQGDAVLIQNDGHSVLIDTGSSDAVTGLLRGAGVQSLDLLVITHNHANHLGGADAVLAEFSVKAFLDNGLPSKSKLQETVLSLLDARAVRALPSRAQTIPLGDARLVILPPDEAVARASGDNQNNASLGVLVERGSFRALLPGDAETEELNAWLDASLIPDVDVLKASHHGSRNGVTPRLIHVARPEMVVISCGLNNDYGHPHLAAMRYYQLRSRVLRTDELGAITIRVQSDGRYGFEAGRQPPSAQAASSSPPPALPLSAPHPSGAPATACCQICRRSKACGDGCIAALRVCRKPPGCACEITD